MNTLSERVQSLLDSKRMTIYAFWQETGLDQGVMGKLLRGETKKPTAKTLKLIANYFQVDRNWLLTGNGESGIKERPDKENYNKSELFTIKKEPIMTQKMLEDLIEIMKNQQLSINDLTSSNRELSHTVAYYAGERSASRAATNR